MAVVGMFLFFVCGVALLLSLYGIGLFWTLIVTFGLNSKKKLLFLKSFPAHDGECHLVLLDAHPSIVTSWLVPTGISPYHLSCSFFRHTSSPYCLSCDHLLGCLLSPHLASAPVGNTACLPGTSSLRLSPSGIGLLLIRYQITFLLQ